MARNGAGTYTLPAGNPVTTGTTISSTWANNTLNDIASSLTASLAYDGQTAPVANLPMATYAHTNVGNATVRTMYAAAGQVQDGALSYLTSVSGTDTITAVAPISMSAYAAGQTFRFIAAGANTTTSVTLNINSIGAKSVTKNGTTALSIGDIPSGSVVVVTYDGTQFQISNVAPAVVAVSSFSAGTTGFTPSTGTTGAVTLAGTLNVANGGTGATTLTAGSLVAGNGTSAVSLIAPGSAGNVLTSDGTTWSSVSKISSGTTQTTTSGTNIDFTGIPSGIKRITVLLNNVSLSAGQISLQLGYGSTPTYVTTGYIGSIGNTTSGGASNATTLTSTNGFITWYTTGNTGSFILNLLGSNVWVASSNMGYANNNAASTLGGVLSLGNTLTAIRITSYGTSGTFNSGSINILYE